LSLTLLALAAVLSCPAVDAAEPVHVYVNGVLVNGLQDQVLSDVTVTFDEHGDVRIDAPNVKIGRSSTPALAEAPPAQTDAFLSSDVPLGRWWLVASDTGSRGVQIDVRVNGQLVRVVASGEPQLLVDLGPHLHRGPNQLTLTARAQGRPGGDPLKVYVGTGSNQTGVLELGQPQVTFAPTADEVREGVTRVYSVTVD
jgi:hypothetical protein